MGGSYGDRTRAPKPLELLLFFVLRSHPDPLAPEDLRRGDGRRLDRDTAEVRRVAVCDRVIGGRRNEDEVALGDFLRIAGDGHGALPAGDNVDLLRLLMGVELLIDAGGDLEPGHGHVPGPQFPCVHKDAISKPVPLLHGSVREPPDQHAAFLADQPFTTKLTRRPGTTISFATAFPSRCRWTFSLPFASSSSSSSPVSAPTSTRSRSLPFTCTISM